MQLAFNALDYMPMQPMDNPEQFPAYELLEGRKDVNNPDSAWREAAYEYARTFGLDGDTYWVETRVTVATIYAKEDGTYGEAQTTKNRVGRPFQHPVIPGESPDARRLRLNRERQARHRTHAQARNTPAAVEYREAGVAMAAAKLAYEQAKARLSLAKIAFDQETGKRG